MHIYIYLLIIFLVLIFMRYLSNKFRFGLDVDFKKPQSIHVKPIPRLLGLSFILLLIFISTSYQNILTTKIILYSILIASIAIPEDFNLKINSYYRLIIQFSCLLTILLLDKEIILLNNLSLLNEFNLNKSEALFLIIFSILAILSNINAFNFIDGCNGLVIGYTQIVLFALLFISDDFFINQIIYLLILHNFILLFLNFPKSFFFLGDFGSYFLGAFISIVIIYFSNNPDVLKNDIMINDWFYANILAYPFYEMLSSIIRRAMKGKSPFLPDNLHLHSILRVQIKHIKFSNPLTSIIILSINIFLLYLLFNFIKIDAYLYFFIFQIIFYTTLKKVLINNINE